MPFPHDALAENEEVALHLHPHAKALIRPALVVVGSLVMLGVGLAYLPPGPSGTVSLYVLFGLVLVLIGCFAAVPYLRWRTTHYVFTTERVLVRTGVLRWDRRDIPLSRINDHATTQRFVERLLGCGTLSIESAGERGQMVLADLPRIERVQTALYELVEEDRLAHLAVPAAPDDDEPDGTPLPGRRFSRRG
ncbi:membrane protein [Pilimelia anulata]|uniref:Membrane protein n=1 Tax=Pilimelia anulata TaxID=53371 RepID=A0A8J3B8J1_9ACTN|nr:PH domain-containing protein [Pilimelia anulata]GGJ93142.1 membrane protein [Pilimelia anulata]